MGLHSNQYASYGFVRRSYIKPCSSHTGTPEQNYPASFTSRYNVDKLIYFFLYDAIEDAIAEEKRIKGESRKAKIDLVQVLNPEWKDLWLEEVFKW